MPANKSFPQLLRYAADEGASDIHLMAGTPVRLRIGGELRPIGSVLSPDETLSVAAHILQSAGRPAPASAEELIRSLRELDCAYSMAGVGRYRVNISRQRGSAMIVLHVIPGRIPSLADLSLPAALADIALERRGLVLVAGTTGAGKSSTVAAMVQHINTRRRCKVITVEDPIEFVYNDAMASIAQREVGTDTDGFVAGTHAALRQDPDVILIGELRDGQTVDVALKAAETGHLVMSTVHTPDAARTVGRLVSLVEADERSMLRVRLADCLTALVSQRLLPARDAVGRVPAVEIVRSTEAVRGCIIDPGQTAELVAHVDHAPPELRMQSFERHIRELSEAGRISAEVARAATPAPSELEPALA